MNFMDSHIRTVRRTRKKTDFTEQTAYILDSPQYINYDLKVKNIKRNHH